MRMKAKTYGINFLITSRLVTNDFDFSICEYFYYMFALGLFL
jgi:hypothetical protein